MKRFKKVAALALAAVMVLGVAATADVQAESEKPDVKEHVVEEVLIVPVAHESDPEFSSYYADLTFVMEEGTLTGIKVTSGFGPQRAEGSNVTYTVNALSQYIDWLQTGNNNLSQLVSTDTYSGATSSLGRFGSVHVELPDGLWTAVADKVDITIVRNSTPYTTEGAGETVTTTYEGYVQDGKRVGFDAYKEADKSLKKLKDGEIKNTTGSSSGGHDHGDKVTLDEYVAATLVGEEDGWKTYQITTTTEEYKLSAEAPVSYFFLNYTRFNAEEVTEEMAIFDVETGLLKINMNSDAAIDEKTEVIDGLTLAKLTLKFVSEADETVTSTGTVKIDLTETLAGDDEGTAGDEEAGTDTKSPSTGDGMNMYLVLAAGAAVALLSVSLLRGRIRA